MEVEQSSTSLDYYCNDDWQHYHESCYCYCYYYFWVGISFFNQLLEGWIEVMDDAIDADDNAWGADVVVVSVVVAVIVAGEDALLLLLWVSADVGDICCNPSCCWYTGNVI